MNHLQECQGDKGIKYKKRILNGDIETYSWQSFCVPLAQSIIQQEGKSFQFCAELDQVIVTYETWTHGKSPPHKQLRLESCGAWIMLKMWMLP